MEDNIELEKHLQLKKYVKPWGNKASVSHSISKLLGTVRRRHIDKYNTNRVGDRYNTTLYKAENTKESGNYIGSTLLSNVCKVYGRLVNNKSKAKTEINGRVPK